MHQIPDLIFLDYYLLFPFRQSWCRCLLMTTISTIAENFLTNGLLGQTLNSDTSENFTNSEYFNDYVQFYRIGRIVYCSYGGDIKKLVPSKEVQILKLPQKFLPVKDYILMTSPPTGGTIQITISKIGWIVAYNYGQEIASLSPSRFSAAYIAAE